MGVGSGLIHVRCRRKAFTFAVSSSDEFLSLLAKANLQRDALQYINMFIIQQLSVLSYVTARLHNRPNYWTPKFTVV